MPLEDAVVSRERLGLERDLHGSPLLDPYGESGPSEPRVDPLMPELRAFHSG